MVLGYSRERVQPPLPFEALSDTLVLLSYYVAIILSQLCSLYHIAPYQVHTELPYKIQNLSMPTAVIVGTWVAVFNNLRSAYSWLATEAGMFAKEILGVVLVYGWLLRSCKLIMVDTKLLYVILYFYFSSMYMHE